MPTGQSLRKRGLEMRFTGKNLAVVGVVLGFVALGSPALAAPADAETTAIRLLTDYERGLIKNDFRTVGDREVSRLQEGEAETITVSLKAGVEYAFIATCDEDCNDLDLELTDEDGDVVSRDVDVDDNPLINYTPRYSGDYELEIAMADCDVEPCVYGARMLVRPDNSIIPEKDRGQQASSGSDSDTALAAILGLGLLLFADDNKTKQKSQNYKK